MQKIIFLYLICLFLPTIASQDANFVLLCNEQTIPYVLHPEKSHEKKIQSYELISAFSLKTTTNITVPVKLYDRKSDVLIIVAGALPASKESTEFFAKLFSNSDVIVFDYRWANKYEAFLLKSILSGNPIKKILDEPLEELKTVVDYALKRKHYKTVVGFGQCYGCYHLAKLQADTAHEQGFGPFTHLIFDSCWYSLRHFAEQICSDPFLPLQPQEGGAPEIITWLTNTRVFKDIALTIAFAFMKEVSIEPYISKITIPLLFIHGKNDLFVPLKHFDKIWNATPANYRAALLTPYQHSNNVQNKALYRFMVNRFIENSSIEQFAHH